MAMRTAVVEEKLRRIPLIRQSRAEANNAANSCTVCMGSHRRTPNSQAPGWYDNFRNENIFDA